MAQLHCPTCGRSFDREASRALPFCSDRCRQVDLGRWLKEEMTLPADLAPEEEPARKEQAADDPSE